MRTKFSQRCCDKGPFLRHNRRIPSSMNMHLRDLDWEKDDSMNVPQGNIQ